ncbi:MAG: toprim domain-containing protein [Verrucomicrobiota bacterium]
MSFKRVTKLNPCPVCKKPDWCRVFADGWVECMRVQSDRPAKSGGWMWQQPSGLRSSFNTSPAMTPMPTINATKLMRDWWTSTDDGMRDGFARELGLTAASLVSIGAAWSAPFSAWAFPMRDGYGNIVGIRLRNENGKFAVRGSRQGIFVAAVLPQPTLYVCEGPTDTAAAVELGLFAVGRPNCCCGGEDIKIFARRHQCQYAVIIADNDKPGLDGARKVGLEIGLRFAVYVPPAKDFREFVRLGGSCAMIRNTLKNTLWTL